MSSISQVLMTFFGQTSVKILFTPAVRIPCNFTTPLKYADICRAVSGQPRSRQNCLMVVTAVEQLITFIIRRSSEVIKLAGN